MTRLSALRVAVAQTRGLAPLVPPKSGSVSQEMPRWWRPAQWSPHRAGGPRRPAPRVTPGCAHRETCDATVVRLPSGRRRQRDHARREPTSRSFAPCPNTDPPRSGARPANAQLACPAPAGTTTTEDDCSHWADASLNAPKGIHRRQRSTGRWRIGPLYRQTQGAMRGPQAYGSGSLGSLPL